MLPFLRLRRAVALAAAAVASACGSVPDRNPVPAELALSAAIEGIPRARLWGDEAPPWQDEVLGASREELEKHFGGILGVPHNYLALSGGGENGAFGAGLLCGWTEAGDRPEFTMVTGISTGALIAPFAFLGPKYDDRLREIYTTYATDDLIERRGRLSALYSDAFATTEPLARLLAKYVDEEMIGEIAAEHRKGRRLFVGTTNLDAARPVIWNIGEIAASGRQGSAELIHKVLLASASIPVAFPPVYIDVAAGGRTYDEMHVDGGATSQVFLYPLGMDWRQFEEKLEVVGQPRAYMIRNAQIAPDWKAIDPGGLLPIASRTIDSLIRTQGLGDMFRIYLGARRDGVDFSLARIPEDFTEQSTEAFDPVYMRKLFDRGFAMARAGYPWEKTPPGMD